MFHLLRNDRYTLNLFVLRIADYSITLRSTQVIASGPLVAYLSYMRSFRILQEAFVSKGKELFISLQFLVIVTLMLSFVLFFYEHDAQPEIYSNGISSVVWAFAQYIGDPGSFADTPPVTFVGRIIACIIGLLGIAFLPYQPVGRCRIFRSSGR